MEMFIIILITVFIVLIARQNNKGKANWIDTISIVLDSITESTIQSIGLNALQLSDMSFNTSQNNLLEQKIAESVAFSNSFIIIIIDNICTIAKNGTHQPNDVRNVASIILQHTYLCTKLHTVYVKALTSVNSTRNKGDTIMGVKFDHFKESLKIISQRFG